MTLPKILQYFIDSKIELDILKKIEQTCFVNSKLYKFAKRVPVYILGDYDKSYKLYVAKMLNKIDSASNNFHLYYDDRSKENGMGIFIHFKKGEKKLPIDSVKVISKLYHVQSLYPKRFKTEITVHFDDSISVKNLSKISESIFCALGPIYENSNIFNEDDEIKHKYLQLIDAINNTVFPDGYLIKDYQTVMSQYQKYKQENIY